MVVYRIAKKSYLLDLSGTGARLYGGRWNRVGVQMIYTSTHLSLAVLELLANHVRHLVDDYFGYIKLSIPDHMTRTINKNTLHQDWRISPYHDSTIQIGSSWVQHQSSLALTVPSAVLHHENNVLINPLHPDARTIEVVEMGELGLDGRVTPK